MANVQYQVPRHSFYWLLLATLLATVPHALNAGWWLKLMLPLLLVTRWRLHIGRGAMPNKWVRSALMVLVLALVWRENGHVFSTEASTQLLVGAFLLKLLEMHRQRDAYVLLVLGYFVAATVFLFYQGPFAALYVLLLLWLLTAALVGINVPTIGWSWRSHGRTSAVILLQSVPVMVVLFIFVPRFGPLWAIPSHEGKAKTGMTDTLTLGSISELSESTELAFRVEFYTQPPEQHALYWRGLVLSEFDGQTWHQGQRRNAKVLLPQRQTMPHWWEQLEKKAGEPEYHYRVLLEPSGQRWLYALRHSISSTARVGATFGGTLATTKELNERFVYELESYPEYVMSEPLASEHRDYYLALPALVDPQARQLAAQLKARYPNPEERVEGALDWFRGEPFHYTLTPPKTGTHANDDFLFGTQRGFCEHYASAFAFMMRAAGIPARIVVGYQGGEWNPRSQHLSVYQYHAHAWVEVWLAGLGWVRVDPTATVAPERIEKERTVVDASDSRAHALWYGNRLILSLRAQLDWVEFNWQRWVLSYDEQQQERFLAGVFGEITPMKLAYSILFLVLLLLVPTLFWTFWVTRGPRLTAAQYEFLWMRRLLHRKGRVPLALTKTATVPQLAAMGAQYWPHKQPVFERWAFVMEQMLYAEQNGTLLLKEAQQERKKLRRLPKCSLKHDTKE